MIGRLADEALAAGVSEIYLSTNDPEPYRFLGLKSIPDQFHGCGPLAGIHSALMETGADSILVLACDLPGISAGEIKTILQAATDEPASVVYAATRSGEHPLCSVVCRELLDPLTRTLSEGKYGVLEFFHGVDHRTVLFEDEGPFLNMNAPDDLRAWEGTGAL